MPGPIGMITLRHEVTQWYTLADVRRERRKTIDQSKTMPDRKIAHLVRVVVQEIRCVLEA